MENQVNKLRIMSIKKPSEYFKGGGSLGGVASAVGGALNYATGLVFEVQINPELISHNFRVAYKDVQVKGKEPGVTEKQFDGVEPAVLDLKFILDGTGTVQNNALFSADLINIGSNEISTTDQLAFVPTKLTQLKAAVYNFVDESHKPPTLIVNWGKLVFVGVLEEMAINDLLMHPSGIPLRSEVNLKIKEQGLGKTASALLSLLSPDLTRHHLIRAGENILRLCDDYYENEHYYLEIAKINGLTNFRKIIPGQNLVFPPIDKSAAK